MGSMGQNKMEQNIAKAIGSYKSSTNKSLMADVLKESVGVKSTKFYAVINPNNNKVESGTLSQVAKKLGVAPNTIKSRFDTNSKQIANRVKGSQVVRFQNLDDLAKFKSTFNTKDIKVEKKKDKKKNFKIANAGFHENGYWGTAEHRYNLNISTDGLSVGDIEQIFKDSLEMTINKQKLEKDDRVRIIIDDPNLSHMISVPLQRLADFNLDAVFDVIEEAVESNEEFVLSSDTTITYTSIKIPKLDDNLLFQDEVGSYNEEIHNLDELDNNFLKNPNEEEEDDNIPVNIHKLNKAMKRSIIQIKNKDEMCFARAVVTGIARIEYGVKSSTYDNMKRGRKDQQLFAEQLLEELGWDKEQKVKLTPENIALVEGHTGFKITIIDGDNFNNVYYPNIKSKNYKPANDDLDNVYLYKHKNHIDLIANDRVAGFFCKENWCHKCKKTFKRRDCHKCPFKCNMCCMSDCPSVNIPKHLKKYDIQCADCFRFFPCNECFDNHLVKDKKGKSVCDKVWKCHKCKKVLSRDTQPPDTHKCGDYVCHNCHRLVDKNHKCYMFPKKLKEPSEKYIFFDFEADISGEEHIVMYSVSQYFSSAESIIHEDINQWCEWAFQKEHKGYTFIAHNGRGYDYKFIIRWVYANTDYQPFVIFAGQKIMYMAIKELNVRFIDSLSFITRPLKVFPKIFGEKELKKGYFPHWFNTKQNWTYIGDMPPKEEFRCDSFNEKDRADFLEWYDEKVKSGYVWNHKKEMEEYCISDVDILRKCCIKFRQLYLSIASIDPFQYLTIASVCMAIFKYHFIDKSFPYRYKEFNDKWQGDPSKYEQAEREQYNLEKETFENDTYEIVFQDKKIGIVPHKDTEFIRQSFFGGRTNACKLIYNFKEGEEGKYADVTSLYPTVNYYDDYPKGHYEIIDEEWCNENQKDMVRSVRNKEFYGFIDCSISPPKKLYHPLLPRKGEKLIFDLNDKRGVWTSKEVYKAIDLGYKIRYIHKIFHYPETTKDLFKDYVATFLKIKQEASGYPLWVKNETDKDKYINDYFHNQGIRMDKSKIVKNPGLREIAKLCLNSLWGKFGQRTNLGRCEILKDKGELIKIILNPKYENVEYEHISDDKVQVNYHIKDKYVENDFNTSIAIASFTTSSARLRLYEGLEKLQRQVLYFDTDSVVYRYNPNDPNNNKCMECGDYLGDWTDELDGVKMIGTFVSGGPKNYSYETDDGEYHTKVKGISLNYEVRQKINHLTIIDLVKKNMKEKARIENITDKDERQKEYDKLKIKVGYDTIMRGKEHTLSNFYSEKRYGLVYDKRSILPPDEYGNYDTLPFGYEDSF
jgi:hypothetical protein